MLAGALGLPLGRATVEGLTVLAEPMGLDGATERPHYKVHEMATTHVRALPEALRFEALRFASGAPIDDRAWGNLKADLGDFLGMIGYRWLASLAIWPQLQWDMTLFLGINLEEEGEPLYSEARVAALTQLPWLRDGRMPSWLRRRLIADLPEDYRERVRALIWSLVDGRIDQGKGPGSIVWRLGVEPGFERHTPGYADGLAPDLLREQIFVDTLANGHIPDKDLALAAEGKAASALRRLLGEIGGVP